MPGLELAQTSAQRVQAACQDATLCTGQMPIQAGHALLTRSMPSLVKAAWSTL